MGRLTGYAALFLLLFFSLSQSFACAGTDRDKTPPVSDETSPVSADVLVEGYNRFGIDLLLREAEVAGEDNLFVSPVSVALCLGMAYIQPFFTGLFLDEIYCIICLHIWFFRITDSIINISR